MMKKTFTINISGIIFHIDEDAYDKLRSYMEGIKRHFAGTEGKEEIISDIENRIAEILQEKISDSKQVITLEDVDKVIATMGEPYEISEEEEPAGDETFRTRKTMKRLYRDPDSKMIGGLCSGMGAYFNIDPIWFRLVFILTSFIGGTGIIVYLILWLVVPEARSTAEKLEMKGEKVNIANIEKSIKDEIDHLKNKLNNLKEDAKDVFKKKRYDFHQNNFEKVLDFFLNILKYFVKGIAIVFGIVLIVAGIFLIVGFFGSFFNPTHISIINPLGLSYFSIPDILNIFFTSPSQFSLAVIGLLLLIGIPILMLIYNGIKLIIGWKGGSRYVGLTAFSFWIAGLIIIAFISLQIVKSFSHKSRHTKNYTIERKARNTLYLDINNNDSLLQYIEYEDNLMICNWNIVSTESTNVLFGVPKLEIIKSKDADYHIIIHSISHGNSRRNAYRHAEKTVYSFKEKEDTIIFDQFYILPENEKWKGQQIKILVRVPVGKSIELSKEMDNFFKVEDYYDYSSSDLPGNKWEMTENGLRAFETEKIESPYNCAKNSSRVNIPVAIINV